MDLVHSKVSLAFVVKVLNTPRGSAALSLAPSLRYTTGILALCFLILQILALLTRLTGLALDLLCQCRIAWPSQSCCPNLSALIGPALSSLLGYCQTAPFLPRCHHCFLLTFYLMEPPNLAVLLLLLVVFLFLGVSLFIIIIQEIASQLKLKVNLWRLGSCYS